MSGDDKKELRDLLKSQLGVVALRLLKSTLIKDITRTESLPVEEQQKDAAQMSDLVDDQWGRDKLAASDEHRRELAGLPALPGQQHFLEDHMPHLESPVKPWLLYEIGLGSKEGRPLNHGAPLDSNEVMNEVESGKWDPHRIAIRPSDKSKGWIALKVHPNFMHGVGRHIVDQHNKFNNNEIPVAQYENALPKPNEELNTQDIERIHASHKRR
jgi:hypothetical protein